MIAIPRMKSSSIDRAGAEFDAGFPAWVRFAPNKPMASPLLFEGLCLVTVLAMPPRDAATDLLTTSPTGRTDCRKRFLPGVFSPLSDL
jgi:hypothetical protein